MAFKAILLDIDGTLYNTKKEVTPKTLEILKKAQDHGIRLILASGRTVQGLMHLAGLLEMEKHHGLLIACNGGRVVDVESGQELFSKTIPIEEAQSVLRHLENFKARPVIDRDDYMYVKDVFDNTITVNGEKRNILEYESRSNGYSLCEKKDLAGFADFPLCKILTYGDPEYLQAHHTEMAAPFEGRLNMVFTAPFYFEYTAKGVDKAKALDTILPQLGLEPEELIAFGDAQNDKTMLEYAGCGVAMDNADPALKEIADYVTRSNDEDGIAFALEHFIPELA